MTPASRHVVWKMLCQDIPASPEVIVANTLNFKPNFKFSRSDKQTDGQTELARYSIYAVARKNKQNI